MKCTTAHYTAKIHRKNKPQMKIQRLELLQVIGHNAPAREDKKTLSYNVLVATKSSNHKHEL